MQEHPGRRPDSIDWPLTRKARKAHVCRKCGVDIPAGAEYVQDIAWAPYGNGARYCQPCATAMHRDYEDWNSRLEAYFGFANTKAATP